MKLEPQILRDAADSVALGSAAIKILIGMAVIVALCTAMAALSELRRGIAAPVGWLALGLVGTVLAAAFRARDDTCGALRAPLCRPCLVLFQRRRPHGLRRPLQRCCAGSGASLPAVWHAAARQPERAVRRRHRQRSRRLRIMVARMRWDSS